MAGSGRGLLLKGPEQKNNRIDFIWPILDLKASRILPKTMHYGETEPALNLPFAQGAHDINPFIRTHGKKVSFDIVKTLQFLWAEICPLM